MSDYLCLQYCLGWLTAYYILLFSFLFCLFDTRPSAMADFGAHKDPEKKILLIFFVPVSNVFLLNFLWLPIIVMCHVSDDEDHVSCVTFVRSVYIKT